MGAVYAYKFTPLLYVGAAAAFLCLHYVVVYMYVSWILARLHFSCNNIHILGACVGGRRALCINTAAAVAATIFWH